MGLFLCWAHRQRPQGGQGGAGDPPALGKGVWGRNEEVGVSQSHQGEAGYSHKQGETLKSPLIKAPHLSPRPVWSPAHLSMWE